MDSKEKGNIISIDMEHSKVDFLEITKKIWHTFFLGTKEEIIECVNLMSEDCIGIRPGRSNFYIGKQSFFGIIDIIYEQRSHFTFELKNYWGEKQRISADVYLVYGGFDVIGVFDKEYNELKIPTKFTLLYHYNGHKWEIINIFVIIPYEDQENDEYFPITLSDKFAEAQKKLRELNENNRLHEQEKKITDAVRIALQENSPADSLNVLFKEIGHIFSADRVYVYEFSEEESFTLLHQWTANGIISEREISNAVSARMKAFWHNEERVNCTTIIPDISIFKDAEPLVYQSLKNRGVHSLMSTPLYLGQKFVGIVGVENQRINTDGMSEILYMLASYVGSIVQRMKLVKKLSVLSYQDQMTMFGNRHAMIAYVEKRKREKSIGILFSDVTGLKYVNDTQGHDAGDALILRACDAIKKAFSEYECFRSGGDELLALCEGITQDEFEQRICNLRKEVEKNEVTLAIGSVWSDNSNEIDKLVSQAEMQMYSDKNEYYARTGKDRRRV